MSMIECERETERTQHVLSIHIGSEFAAIDAWYSSGDIYVRISHAR